MGWVKAAASEWLCGLGASGRGSAPGSVSDRGVAWWSWSMVGDEESWGVVDAAGAQPTEASWATGCGRDVGGELCRDERHPRDAGTWGAS